MQSTMKDTKVLRSRWAVTKAFWDQEDNLCGICGKVFPEITRTLARGTSMFLLPAESRTRTQHKRKSNNVFSLQSYRRASTWLLRNCSFAEHRRRIFSLSDSWMSHPWFLVHSFTRHLKSSYFQFNTYQVQYLMIVLWSCRPRERMISIFLFWSQCNISSFIWNQYDYLFYCRYNRLSAVVPTKLA